MGTLQALEIKLLSRMETPSGELRLFDGKTSQWRGWRCVDASGCPVCGGACAEFNSMTSRCEAPKGQMIIDCSAPNSIESLKPGVALWRSISGILPREQWRQQIVQEGDQILLFGMCRGLRCVRIADKTFDSHLFTGTGKFASSQLMVERFAPPTASW